MFEDKKNKLSVVSIVLHWAVALMFIGMIAIGMYMDEMPVGPDKFQIMALHKSIGAIFFVLAVIRVIHRLVQGFPENLSQKSVIQDKVAKGIHHLLLLATVLIPLTGIMMSVGGGHGLQVFGLTVFADGDKIAWMSSIGHAVHGFAALSMAAVVALHAAAGIKQQFVDKSLSRMVGRSV